MKKPLEFEFYCVISENELYSSTCITARGLSCCRLGSFNSGTTR